MLLPGTLNTLVEEQSDKSPRGVNKIKEKQLGAHKLSESCCVIYFEDIPCLRNDFGGGTDWPWLSPLRQSPCESSRPVKIKNVRLDSRGQAMLQRTIDEIKIACCLGWARAA